MGHLVSGVEAKSFTGVRVTRKSCVVGNSTRKMQVEDSQRSNIAEVFERLKTVSQRRGVDEMKAFDSTSFSRAV